MFGWLDRQVCRLLAACGIRTPLFTSDNIQRCFARCEKCRRVYPHWQAEIRVEEYQNGQERVGCKCGCPKLNFDVLCGWEAFYWLMIRGYLIRHLIQHRRVWDPRIPIRMQEAE